MAVHPINPISILQSAYGGALVGFTVTTALYGMGVAQVFFYWRLYPEDRSMFRVVVAALFVLSTLSIMFMSHAIYNFAILNLGNIVQDLMIPWSTGAVLLTIDMITVLSECCYIHQIWRVSRKKLLVGFISILVTTSFAIYLQVFVQIFRSRSLVVFPYSGVRTTASWSCGISAVADIMIAASLFYFLKGREGNFRSTGQLIRSLVLHVIARGALTAITQLIILILLQSMSNPFPSYWLPFFLISGNLHVNSVLTMLNIRKCLSRPLLMISNLTPRPPFALTRHSQALSPCASAICHGGDILRTADAPQLQTETETSETSRDTLQLEKVRSITSFSKNAQTTIPVHFVTPPPLAHGA